MHTHTGIFVVVCPEGDFKVDLGIVLSKLLRWRISGCYEGYMLVYIPITSRN